jgi:hypothetical protein
MAEDSYTYCAEKLHEPLPGLGLPPTHFRIHIVAHNATPDRPGATESILMTTTVPASPLPDPRQGSLLAGLRRVRALIDQQIQAIEQAP